MKPPRREPPIELGRELLVLGRVRRQVVVDADAISREVARVLGGDALDERPRVRCLLCSARSIVGVPCASLAHTYRQRWPRSRWKRTQMSVCTYSSTWPRCNESFAYGRALVTRMVRLDAQLEGSATWIGSVRCCRAPIMPRTWMPR